VYLHCLLGNRHVINPAAVSTKLCLFLATTWLCYWSWKQIFSCLITDWTQNGNSPRIEDNGGSLWKWLHSVRGSPAMMMSMVVYPALVNLTTT